MHVKSKNKKGQEEMITHMLIIILLSTPTLVLVCPELLLPGRSETFSCTPCTHKPLGRWGLWVL